MSRLLITVLGCTACLTAQGILYVDVTATPPGSGSLASPFTSIQSAIVAATSGDLILVAPGTYSETIDYLGKSLVLRSTQGAEVTIIDGGGLGPVVRVVNGEDAATVLEGFTVTGGAQQAPFGILTAGIHCIESSPSIVDCLITCNFGGDPLMVSTGGGIILDRGAPQVIGCTIERNSAGAPTSSPAAGTGGIACVDTMATILGCRIHFNAGGPAPAAGALRIAGGMVRVSDTVIWANSGGFGEPGRMGSAGSCSTLTGAPIPGAAAGPGGEGGVGAISVTDGTLRLSNTIVWGNQGGPGGYGGWGGASDSCPGGPAPGGAAGAGGTGGIGGVRVGPAGVLLMVSCTLMYNAPGPRGSGGFGAGGPGGAFGTPGFGGLASFGGVAQIENSILWSNFVGQIQGSGVMASFSDIQGGYPGFGVFSLNPMLDTEFRLTPGSPCIGAGNNSASNLARRDIDGDPRVFDGTTDIGADEWALSVSLSQASPGAGLVVTNRGLEPGNEILNLFSFEPCMSGLGTGSFLGLCTTNFSGTLFAQAQLPIGSEPFHFMASLVEQSFGPYGPLAPGLVLEAVSVDLTGGVLDLTRVSTVTQLVLQ